MFYFVLFITALIQNLLFISTKSFVIFSPNIVLALLYCHGMKNGGNFVVKGAVGGLYLDLMFDTLGLNIAIKSFICYLIEITKTKVVFLQGFYSHLIVFLFFSIVDLFLRFLFIRIKYAIKFDYAIVVLSIIIEIIVFSLLYLFYKRV